LNSATNKNAIIIVAESPILNPKEIKSYPNLSVNYSVYLNTLLFSNWLEIFSDIGEQAEIITLMSDQDKEYIPKYFLPSNTKIFFYCGPQLLNLSEHLLKNSLSPNNKTLVLFYNSIGVTQSDILRIFNLIQSEESSIVIGKSNRNQIVFTCSYGVDEELIVPLIVTKRKYHEFLNMITSKDIFIHTLDGFLSIDDFEDIKKLYIELSKKESLSFCGQKMHESFNDLFIEYKELLNV